MFEIPAQTSCPGERRLREQNSSPEFGSCDGERDAQRTLTTAPFDASLPDTVSLPTPDPAHTVMSTPNAASNAETAACVATADYDAQRRRVLALAGGAGAALFFLSTRSAHADGFLFDVKTQRTALRVADELLDMSIDYFGRAGNFAKTRPGERQSNALSLVLGQDREVSSLLKLLVRKYDAASGGISQLPNAVAIASPRPYSFPSKTLTSSSEALAFGMLLKDTIVGALHGSLLSIQDPELLGTFAAIAGVQSRHAALVREAAGSDPFPAAFEPALSPKAVSDILAPYGYTGGAPLS